MPCHHCTKARQSTKDAIKAVLTGDLREGATRAKDAAAHVLARMTGDVEIVAVQRDVVARTVVEGWERTSLGPPYALIKAELKGDKDAHEAASSSTRTEG